MTLLFIAGILTQFQSQNKVLLRSVIRGANVIWLAEETGVKKKLDSAVIRLPSAVFFPQRSS